MVFEFQEGEEVVDLAVQDAGDKLVFLALSLGVGQRCLRFVVGETGVGGAG